MKLSLPKQTLAIIESLTKADFDAYVVGGAVRDILIGRPTYDWDFTTNATPEEILKIFPEGFYDNKFGTVGIPNNEENERPYEITTYRTEFGYSDSRRPDNIKWGNTLEEDLERRDFTINAMAIAVDAKNKNQEWKEKTPASLLDYSPSLVLIDHFNGQKDLEKKLVRAVGNPDERFAEDALRMMRALRIASELNFKIEEKTKNAIKTNAPTIRKISRERVRDELLKMIASPHAYNAIIEFREVGLMEEILPELEKAFGVEQKSPSRHHIYDVGTHSVMSLKYCPSQDPIVRLATLIHDIGKPLTYKKLATGVITFYNHEIAGAKIAKRIADRLKLSKKQSDKLYKLVRYHQFTVDEKQTDSAIRRFINNIGKDLVSDMLDLRVADRLGGGARETSWRLEEFKKRLIDVQKQPFTVQDLKINGVDIMKELKMKPGPKVGEILNKLYNKVVAKEIANEKEELTNYLRDFSVQSENE